MLPTLLIGAPGTGKTHSLVSKILEIKPDRFAFVSFTRRAAREAKQRLRAFYSEEELKHVQTIHSMCFGLLGIRTAQVMDWRHLRIFGSEYGYEFTGRRTDLEDDTYTYLSDDDVEYREMMVAANKMVPCNSDMCRRYTDFKKKQNLIDFNDMILRAVGYAASLSFDLVCVDEIQDLTPLQYAFIQCLVQKANQIIYAGDGNQMIYEWAGVERKQFLQLQDLCETEELKIQYRIPGDIYWMACAAVGRTETSFKPVGNNVHYGLVDHFKKDESYLLLTRNGYLLKRVARELEEQGVSWTFLTYDYDKTNVRLSTIHASKGAEADNIVLYTDVSPATYEHIEEEKEGRVWYVGMTRARKRLYLVPPETDYYYEI